MVAGTGRGSAATQILRGTASTLLLPVELSTVLELGVADNVDVEGASGGASATELLEVATPPWPFFIGDSGVKGYEGAPTPDPALLLQALVPTAAGPANGRDVRLGACGLEAKFAADAI